MMKTEEKKKQTKGITKQPRIWVEVILAPARLSAGTKTSGYCTMVGMGREVYCRVITCN